MHRWRHQVGGVCAALEGALGSGTALVRGSLHFPLPGSWGETECEVAHLLHFPRTEEPGLEGEGDRGVELGQEGLEFWRGGATQALHSLRDPQGT